MSRKQKDSSDLATGLKWHRGSKYHQVDSDKKYSISASKVEGKWIYILWDVETKKFLGRFENAKAAKEVADDLERDRRKSD